jgi:hypothetical protein
VPQEKKLFVGHHHFFDSVDKQFCGHFHHKGSSGGAAHSFGIFIRPKNSHLTIATSKSFETFKGALPIMQSLRRYVDIEIWHIHQLSSIPPSVFTGIFDMAVGIWVLKT